jgi:HD-GYP domain-containing protein (c-di-GMP phosphodiesterase class II)
MIRDIPYLTLAVPAVRHHHERYDGNGYPDGLAGDTIPLEARIVTVADGLDAMTTTRSYRVALSLNQACDEIARCSGTQFDPLVVEAFRRAWDSHQIHLVMANGHI